MRTASTAKLNRWLLLWCAPGAIAFSLAACEYLPEASFELAKQSRLPKWFTLPTGVSRDKVSLTMNTYSTLLGARSQFVLRNSKEDIIEKAYGKLPCNKPLRESNADYPAYEPVIVNGVTDIIEYRWAEPLFYVTDDPAIWKQYLAVGCRK